ncbi:hypothetical protein GX586_04755, partial [bacterium]|nr:hypothetical protein [bacterium]
MSTHDRRILRDLVKQYAELAAKPVQEERRRLWTRHNSMKRTRPLVLVTYGMWNVWCREVFGDDALKCADPFYRMHERALRLLLFQDTIGDDSILEPWYTMRAAVKGGWNGLWGVELGRHSPGVEGGAWKFDPPIKEWADMKKLVAPLHVVDEQATQEHRAKLQDAIGDLIEINVSRAPACTAFKADISTDITQLRGLEQLMVDMYESPGELKKLLAFMRDAILE